MTTAAREKGHSKSARTRERILDATAHVLSRKGYAGTRLSDIAEQAQLQAPAIYYYFASRDDVVVEVMVAGVARMREHLRRVLDEQPSDASAMDRISVAVDIHLRYVLTISDYATASIRNSGQLPAAIRSRQLAEQDRYGDLWRELIADAERTGELRAGLDAGAARMLVLGALNWAAEWWDPQRGSLTTLIRTAQSIVRHGLSAS